MYGTYSTDPDVDLEVARYAMRTFIPRLNLAPPGHPYTGYMTSIAASHRRCWSKGVCEAICLADEMVFPWLRWTPSGMESIEYGDSDPIPVQAHPAPGEGCNCGIYGCLSLGDLIHQYPTQCRNIITVFAAEGRTFIGDIGLRTARARVVAYWTETPWVADIAKHSFPDATPYADVFAMAARYGLGIHGKRKEVVLTRAGGTRWSGS
jgi:hypothetical protein